MTTCKKNILSIFLLFFSGFAQSQSAAQEQVYSDSLQYKDGYARMTAFSGKMGIVNRDGKLVVDTGFDALSDYDALHHMYWVKPTIVRMHEPDFGFSFTDGGWGLIGEDGQYILDTIYDQPAFFYNDLVVLVDTRQRFGLMNRNGRTVLPFVYGFISRQWNGTYFLRRDSLWGMADSNGHVIVTPCWDDMTCALGAYALYAKDSVIGLVNMGGGMTTDVERFYNSKNLYLADSLSFFYSTGNYRDMLPELHIGQIVEGYEKTDSMTDKRKQMLLRNLLAMEASMDFFLKNNEMYAAEGPEIYYDPEINEEYIYEIKFEGAEFKIELLDIHHRSFSVVRIIDNYFGMYSQYGYYYDNYAFSGDSLRLLELNDLFIKGFEPFLYARIRKTMKEQGIEDQECIYMHDCLSRIKSSFSIDSKGLEFHFGTQGVEEAGEEILIPYTSIKSIINKKGVLGEFVK